MVLKNVLKCSFLLLMLLAVQCRQKTQKVSTVTIKTVSVEEFKNLLEADGEVVLLDVRTPQEYQEGYIPSAVNVDFWASDFDNKIETLDKTAPVLIYCQSGGRSSKALSRMEALGFEEVYELRGGVKAWEGYGEKLD